MTISGNSLLFASAASHNDVSINVPPSHVIKNFVVRKDELVAAMSTSDFYIQLLYIGIALALSYLMALLIRRRITMHLEKHPPRRIDAEFITKPLGILGPILALIYLSVVRPFAEEYADDVDISDAMIQICLAFLLSKCIVMLVRSRPVGYFIAFAVMVVAVLRATGFINFTVAYLNSMGFDIGQFHISMLNLVHGIVILVVVFWIAGVLSRSLESYLRRSSTLSYSARELSVKFFRVFVYFTALMITLSVLGVDLTAFAVFGGALGVGVGLGLQKITANFVSGIILLLEKSIKIGDLIEVGANSGWVRELNIRYALMETADGREVMIPNEELVSTRVTSWTHTTNSARVDIKVNVDYRANPHKVREVMLEAARSHSLCLKKPAPSCWLREFGDNAMVFLLTFWIPDIHDGRFGPQSEVMMVILDKFRKAGIGIPCPASENETINLTPMTSSN